MRFLVDPCAGRRLADWLRDEGHDVTYARDLGENPGDRALLLRAAREQRVAVTLDKGFSALIFLEGAAHVGLVILPDVPPGARIELMRRVLEMHAGADLTDAVITTRGTFIRLMRTSG